MVSISTCTGKIFLSLPGPGTHGLDLRVGHAGWTCWLDTVVGHVGWTCQWKAWTHWSDTLVGHVGQKHWLDTPVRHASQRLGYASQTHRWNTSVRHTGQTDMSKPSTQHIQPMCPTGMSNQRTPWACLTGVSDHCV